MNTMKVSIWDTYVKRKDGKLMHFDIVVQNNINDEQTILNFGMDYLKEKPFETDSLSAEKCRFCHIEQATDLIIEHIKAKGFHIIEMEHCEP